MAGPIGCASSACSRYGAPASASEYTATERIFISRNARISRLAMAPRLATMTLWNMARPWLWAARGSIRGGRRGTDDARLQQRLDFIRRAARQCGQDLARVAPYRAARAAQRPGRVGQLGHDARHPDRSQFVMRQVDEHVARLEMGVVENVLHREDARRRHLRRGQRGFH